MTEAEKLKGQIVQEISRLPEQTLLEVLDFVSHLPNGRQADDTTTSANPEHDPILKFAGGIAHGSLAHEIDHDLYGA
jgi:hypothetical protein